MSQPSSPGSSVCSVAGCEAPATLEVNWIRQGLACTKHARSQLRLGGWLLVVAGVLLMLVGAWSSWRLWRFSSISSMSWLLYPLPLIAAGWFRFHRAKQLSDPP